MNVTYRYVVEPISDEFHVLGPQDRKTGVRPIICLIKAKDSALAICGILNGSLGSVLQPWVMKIPLRAQGTLMTAVRGCDFEAKQWKSTGVAYSPGRRLTAFIRWCFMVPADAREVDSQEGAFMMSDPPTPFKPSEFGHLPEHWYAHAMHALEVIGVWHSDRDIANQAWGLYEQMCHNLHVRPELPEDCERRLTEDRIANNTVVS